jgi:hypothetical protein
MDDPVEGTAEPEVSERRMSEAERIAAERRI